LAGTEIDPDQTARVGGKVVMRKRSGFTLIELLVVIAIIGILAAMLFPVFARARESARKTQCLANVKNIAMAFQIYFTDYDRFPPGEHNQEVIQFFSDKGCDMSPGCCDYPTLANPYLRWPAILDEYTKSREVWRCPSARNVATAQHVNGSANWFPAVATNWNPCVCQEWWPNGWGGTVTDSVTLVDGCPGNSGSLATGAVEIDYVDTHKSGDLEKTVSSIGDASRHLVLAERGIKSQYWGIEQIAYPEICRVFWNSDLNRTSSCAPGCGDGATADCGPPDRNTTDIKAWINNFWRSPDARKRYTRHMGGNNLGFADGHAKWWAADAMVAAANADPQEIEPVNSQDLP
jgi:prepilin-type N-terminal cleavage/methylation domain-containing protein/prepilin-type processing-associated H-X9-DG protein